MIEADTNLMGLDEKTVPVAIKSYNDPDHPVIAILQKHALLIGEVSTKYLNQPPEIEQNHAKIELAPIQQDVAEVKNPSLDTPLDLIKVGSAITHLSGRTHIRRACANAVFLGYLAPHWEHPQALTTIYCSPLDPFQFNNPSFIESLKTHADDLKISHGILQEINKIIDPIRKYLGNSTKGHGLLQKDLEKMARNGREHPQLPQLYAFHRENLIINLKEIEDTLNYGVSAHWAKTVSMLQLAEKGQLTRVNVYSNRVLDTIKAYCRT